MILDTKVSFFKSTRETMVSGSATLKEVLSFIKNGEYKDIVNQVRGGDSEAKKNLPTVAVHGIFESERKKPHFIESSGIIILDLDDVQLDEIEDTKEEIMASNDHVLAIMTSPSGNGIKVLYFVNPDLVNADNYRAIGKQIVSEFDIYGNVDFLSVTDCLIMTYDPNILINEEAIPAFIYVKETIQKKVELPPLDESLELWGDAEEFFDTVLSEDIASKTNSNFHFIQVAILDLAKFGFKYPSEDLSFVVDYSEGYFKSSSDNKKRFLEITNLAKDYPKTQYPYKYSTSDDEFEDDVFTDYSEYTHKEESSSKKDDSKTDVLSEDNETGLIDYTNFKKSVLEVVNEGDRVGFEVSFKNLAEAFRFKGTGICTITGIPSHGKASSLDSLVYTPTGSKRMGDISVGDKVLSIGGSANVVGVYPQGKKEIYEITFSDGSKAKSCKEHLWLCNNTFERKHRKSKITYSRGIRGRTYTPDKLPMKVRTLSELMLDFKEKDGRRKYNVPLSVAEFSSRKLEIEPYLLGILIGDGGLTGKSIKFTNAEKSIIEELERMVLKFDCKVTLYENESNCFNATVAKKSGKRNKLKDALEGLGMRKLSTAKKIPKDYLFNSKKNRMALLRGLLDTDGFISKQGHVSYSTSSRELSRDVLFLVRSLGGVGNISQKFPTYTYLGEKIKSKNEAYTVSVNLPNSLGNPFFKSVPKRDRWSPNREPMRYIDNIKLHSVEEAQCIMIDSESHLYFTDDFIITHNTELVDAVTLDLARLYGHETFIVGFEQTPEEHVIKLIRKLVGTDVTCPSWFNSSNMPTFDKAYSFVTSKIKHVDVKKVGGNINTILDILAKRIKDSRESGGNPKYVVLDPFNMLSVKGKFSGHEKVEELLRRITHFSHQMGVMVLLVAHPFKMKKDEKTKEYEIPDFYSVKGSSAFYEMSYHGMTVYRQKDNTVLVRILKVKQRNLGNMGSDIFFEYDKPSGRYIPIDDNLNELEGDHREKNWQDKINLSK